MHGNETLSKDFKAKAKVLAYIALGNMDNVKLQKYAPIIKSIKTQWGSICDTIVLLLVADLQGCLQLLI